MQANKQTYRNKQDRLIEAMGKKTSSRLFSPAHPLGFLQSY